MKQGGLESALHRVLNADQHGQVAHDVKGKILCVEVLKYTAVVLLLFMPSVVVTTAELPQYNCTTTILCQATRLIEVRHGHKTA
jgi:hypothetical protein